MSKWIAAIVGIALFCYLSYRWGKNIGESNCLSRLKNQKTVIIQDTVTITAPGTIKTVEKKIFIKDSLTIEDSLAIFETFFLKSNFEANTHVNEVKVKAKGWFWQNRLDSISFQIQNLRPTQSIVNTFKDKTYHLKIGMLGGNNFAAPTLTLQGESWELLGGYNLVQNEMQPTKLVIGLNYTFYEW